MAALCRSTLFDLDDTVNGYIRAYIKKLNVIFIEFSLITLLSTVHCIFKYIMEWVPSSREKEGAESEKLLLRLNLKCLVR